jgi:hypothetical protein
MENRKVEIVNSKKIEFAFKLRIKT